MKEPPPLFRLRNDGHVEYGTLTSPSLAITERDRTVVEYFAGIGLVRLGLEKAGWRVVFANDLDPEKYEMYAAHFRDEKPHYLVQDVFALAPEQVPYATLATCSFPCIDLSLAGNYRGIHGQHSSAFWGFIRILEEQGNLRPPLILIENVTGWLSSNGGQDFRVTVEALNRLGYSCDVYTIDALRFTPQSRPRVFLVGMRLTSHMATEWDLLHTRDSSLLSKALLQAVMNNRDLAWRFLDTPPLPPKRREGLSEKIVEEMAPDDARWWPSEEVERHLRMMAPNHVRRVDELKRLDTISYRTAYRRMRSGHQRLEVRDTDTAGCLRTAVGGSSRQIVIAAGQDHVRMRHMTPREYARLQGVPDTFPIPESLNQALTGFGDAVCVDVIRWIGNNILNPLFDEATR